MKEKLSKDRRNCQVVEILSTIHHKLSYCTTQWNQKFPTAMLEVYFKNTTGSLWYLTCLCVTTWLPFMTDNFQWHDTIWYDTSLGTCTFGVSAFFPEDKAAEAWSKPLNSISCRGNAWAALYLHSPFTPWWRGQGKMYFRWAFKSKTSGMPTQTGSWS